MELDALNPFVRFMDRRICRASYRTAVVAYDFRLFFVTEGACRALLEREPLDLLAGDCLIFPGGTPYRLFFDETRPAGLYVINFDLDCARASLPSLAPEPPERFDSARLIRAGSPSPFDQPVFLPQAQALQEPLARLLAEHGGSRPYRQALCSALLKELLIRALRLQQSDARPVSEPVRRLLDYLEAHFCERITGESLSRRFNYHAYYLERRFRAETGTAIHRYVLSLRLKKSAQLLLSTSLSVSEIAAQCGFSSPSHLAESFKRAYGRSPGQYRDAGRTL